MQLEVGKYYKTRDGRKVGPMVMFDVDTFHLHDKLGVEGCNWIWKESGIGIMQSETLDLIAEWPSETTTAPTLSAETIDHIAIDSLKFHIADNDMEPLQKEAFRIVLRYYGVTL